ncbi:S41 family peptidase [Pedobacter flavus]|uniref:S41 family peptidase n=1 Tax=Pedobacter flavus TaxID=3113906 RepID=A0ABU7H2I5_9SPHI|nr:S41 family peptidase [Pedobacter sp. VNH31]MEE1884791.1 S41 family peptidase [Pedobacter sp. VNH31]
MKQPSRNNILIALTYSVTLTLGMFLGYKFLRDQGYSVSSLISFNEQSDDKRSEIINIIGRNYVDEVNPDSLKHLTIDSLLHQLDPHSTYLPPVDAFEFAENLEGNFGGIGVQYYVLNDTLLVTGVVKDGPAYQAGLKLGDKILKIDSVVVSGKSLPKEKMTGRIRGKMGTNVSLLLKRSNQPQPILMNVMRDRVAVSSIDAGYMLSQDIGYIRISKFGANTDQEFTNYLRELKAKGMKKLVLDLRDNEGGYLTAATGIANQLFPENKLIVYTQGKHEPRTDYISVGGGEFENGKLAVIINEQTASASEIIAGAVQDLERGYIIGRRSFGKGLVQEQFAFQDGSALNLTIARYYTPLGRSIQKSYKKIDFDTYQSEIENRYAEGEFTKSNSKQDTTSKVFLTGSGRKLYGGGGIQPDVFVKIDTIGYNRLYYNLINNRILFDYVYGVLIHRYQPQQLENAYETFNVSESDLKDFTKFAQSRKVNVDTKQFNASKSLIKTDLKSMLYKYYFGDKGYYKAQNVADPMVKKAIQSLNKAEAL